MNVGIAYIERRNTRAVFMIEFEKQKIVGIEGDIKFGPPHSRAHCPGGRVTRRFCNLSDLSFHIAMQEKFFAGEGTGICGIIACVFHA